MSSDLYKKINYSSRIDCIISEYIREYDLSKANINMLLKYKVIDKKTYDQLYNGPKLAREIAVGKMIEVDRRVGEVIKKGIIEAKRLFFIANDINDENIVSIRNDAVFLLNKSASITQVDEYSLFNLKNTYTSFYNLDYYELFYSLDTFSQLESIDIKGIKDENFQKIIPYHDKYFLDFLMTLFNMAQTSTIKDCINYLTTFYNLYISRKLPIEYYREFTTNSFYSIVEFSPCSVNKYYTEFIDPSYKNFVDISFNLDILNKLHRIFANQLRLRYGGKV